MNEIREQIAWLESQNDNWNLSDDEIRQVLAVKNTMEKMLAVVEAAKEMIDHDAEKDFTEERHWIALIAALTALPGQEKK